MKTTTENDRLKSKRESARKRIPSKLDPFTDELLRMGDEAKPLHEILEWLKTQGIETSINNVSAFLISRRERRAAQQQLDTERNLLEAVQEWLEQNPNATLEAVTERFKLLALSLAMQPGAAPEVLKLADRLVGTASRVANDRSRADHRERLLVMEENKHAEWLKDDEARALELCLKEADKHPEVAKMFTAVFIALKRAKGK